MLLDNGRRLEDSCQSGSGLLGNSSKVNSLHVNTPWMTEKIHIEILNYKGVHKLLIDLLMMYGKLINDPIYVWWQKYISS